MHLTVWNGNHTHRDGTNFRPEGRARQGLPPPRASGRRGASVKRKKRSTKDQRTPDPNFGTSLRGPILNPVSHVTTRRTTASTHHAPRVGPQNVPTPPERTTQMGYLTSHAETVPLPRKIMRKRRPRQSSTLQQRRNSPMFHGRVPKRSKRWQTNSLGRKTGRRTWRHSM